MSRGKGKRKRAGKITFEFEMRTPASFRAVRTINAGTEMVEILREYIADVTPLRTHPIGGHGSPARLAQERHVAIDARARAILAWIDGVSEK